jgi:hypothetical protein
MNGVSNKQIAKSDRAREREAVDAVKAWIADWEERKRSLHSAAVALIRSIESGGESSTKRFAESS